MKTACVVCVFLALLFTIYSAQEHQSCSSDQGCNNVTCNNNQHTAYCHSGECHCHSEDECDHDSDCSHCDNDGTDYSCDGGHCHGPDCTHHRK